MTEKFYDTENAARELGGISARTLEKWRLLGNGPAFRKFGKRVLYSDQDLQKWANSRRRISTSDE